MIIANKGEVKMEGDVDTVIAETLCIVGKLLYGLYEMDDKRIINLLVKPELKKLCSLRSAEQLEKYMGG